MKIHLTVECDYDTELHLYSNSENLCEELLRVLRGYVNKRIPIYYDYEPTSINALRGKPTHSNPFPIEPQFSTVPDMKHSIMQHPGPPLFIVHNV